MVEERASVTPKVQQQTSLHENADKISLNLLKNRKYLAKLICWYCYLTLIRMTKDEKGLAFLKGLLL